MKFFLQFFFFILQHNFSNAQQINFSGNNSTSSFTDSDLPIVVIHTNGQTIIDNPKIIVNMGIINNGPGQRNYLTDTPNEYNGNIGIEYRGSHSQTYPKKSFSLETMDFSGTVKTDVSIFNMPPAHDWILNASYVDKSLCRDVLTYQLSNEMGHYAVRTKYVEVVVNGSYQGVYIFSETIKRKDGRLDIANLHPNETTPPDVTGGYIIKIDKVTGNGGGGWTSSYPPIENSIGQTVYFMYDYPSSDSIVPAQEAYIQSYVDSFEDALAGPNFRDSIVGYSHFIGKGSWIDYFFINELSKNIDAYRISTYLYKDKGKTLKAGPVWDYDIAWGNANNCNGFDTTGWTYNFPCVGDGFQVPFWWQKLLQDTNYTNELKCRWKNYRQNILSEQHVHSIIDSVASLLSESKDRNFNKWPILGVYIWPNPSPQPLTYQGEIQNLKNWVHTRLLWLDANIPGHCSCSVTASIQNPSCGSLCDGSATAIGTSPYPKTYIWNNINEANTITDLCAGNYSLIMKDAIGCTKTTTVTISQPSSLSLNINTTNSSCAGNGCNGSATVNGLGGSPPYSYSWSNGQIGATATFLCKGTYVVTVSDSKGCTNSFPVNIQNPDAPVISISSKSNVSCNGGSDGRATVNVSGGTGPYTYFWFPAGGNSSTATGLNSGSYIVTVADATGCSTQIVIEITQPSPSVIHSTIQNALCNGSTGLISLNVTGGSPPFSYSWMPGGSTSPLLNSVQAGTYSVTITDNEGCTKTSSYTISQPQPFIFFPSVTPPTCYGGFDGSASISATGGTGPRSFFWSPLGITSQTVNQITAGEYIVTVTDAVNCTATTTVSVLDPSEISLSISSTPSTCNQSDGTATVNVSNGTSPYSYNWFPSGSTNPTAVNLFAGEQIVMVTDANGCFGLDTVTIVSASGLNVYVFGQVQESCFGSNDAFVSLMVNGGASPYTYSWSPTGGNNSFASDLAPGIYSITISDHNNCQTVYQLNITEPLPLDIGINATPVSCYNTSTGSLNAIVTGGTSPYSYTWFPGRLTSKIINNLSPGNYLVHVTDAHGCTSSESSVVTEPPQLSVSLSKNDSRCGKANGNAIAHVSGGTGTYSYSWSSGSIDSIASNLPGGIYSVTITDSKGCTVRDSVVIGGKSASTVSVSNITPVTCNGGNDGSVVLKTTGEPDFISYSWSPNVSSGPVATNLSSGIYSVILRIGNQCRDSIGFILPQPPPLAALILTENVKCYGAEDGLLFADVGGGTPPYSYLWSNGNQTDSAINLSTGTYSLLITDAHNCTSTATGSITGPDSMHISFNVVNATCSTCMNGSIDAMVNGGVVPYSYNWKPDNQNTNSISDLSAGVYTICVTDANNCLKCDSVYVSGGGIGIAEILKNSGLYVYPNPLNQSAVFAFALNSKQNVIIKIFSASGQLVKTVIDEELNSGEQLIRFDASDLSPGVYFYQFIIASRFQAGALVISR